MEADGHPEAGDQVHDQEDRDVAPVEEVVPDLPADDPERDERQDGDGAGGDPVQGLVRDRLDVIDARLGRQARLGWLGLGSSRLDPLVSAAFPAPVDCDRVGAAPEANEHGGRASRPLAAAHLACVGHRGGRALAQRDRRGPEAPRCASSASMRSRDSRQSSLSTFRAEGMSCVPRAPVSGFQVQSASPTNSAPAPSKSRTQWPGVWPGVWIARGDPGTSSTSPSRVGLGSLHRARPWPRPGAPCGRGAARSAARRRYGRSAAGLASPVFMPRLAQRGLVVGVHQHAGAGLAQLVRDPGVVRVGVGQHQCGRRRSGGGRGRAGRRRGDFAKPGRPASTAVSWSPSSTRYQFTYSEPSP